VVLGVQLVKEKAKKMVTPPALGEGWERRKGQNMGKDCLSLQESLHDRRLQERNVSDWIEEERSGGKKRKIEDFAHLKGERGGGKKSFHT